MRYLRIHILRIIEEYKGTVPLTHYLKNYCRNYPQLGSRDRKLLSEMAFSFYRFSKGLKGELEVEKKLEACLYLSENNLPSQEKLLPQEWLPKPISFQEKIKILLQHQILFTVENCSSITSSLSQGITLEEWSNSLLQQPRLFIRIRKNHKAIQSLLQTNNIAFVKLAEDCYALPNAAAIDKLLQPADYVVQDASSQSTRNYFLPKPKEHWWDVCSGAGGKSLLLKDLEPNVQLTVTDVRASILHNLSERFRLYGHAQPHKIVADIADKLSLPKDIALKQFDNIICDVPCTGSGTWARTPEQAYFFKETTVLSFSERQQKILLNAASHLKEQGRLIYITCSVFKEENENVVLHVASQINFEVISMQLINGIPHKADCMFVAVMRKQHLRTHINSKP